MSLILAIISSLLFAFGSGLCLADGNDKYTPTKLEWLVVELNSQNRHDSVSSPMKTGFYYFGWPPNTIEIVMSREPRTIKKVYDTTLEVAKKSVDRVAKVHGWDWVKIKITEEVYSLKDEEK